MAVRSKRLWTGVLVSTTPLLLYTCPAGETALLKTFTFYNQSAVAATITLGMTSVPTGAHRFMARTLAAGVVEQVHTWLVLPPGGTVYAVSSVASSIRSGCHGTELEGVAD